ncbi:MAG: efflux transporter outer membrane subunit [Pseudomonadota bacterium]
MKKVFILSIVLFAAACSSMPEYRRPEVKTPDSWLEGKAAPAPDLANWWQKFNSPELAALEEKALKQNFTLRAALARVEQARATAKITGAALSPQAALSGSLSGTTQKTGGGSSTYAPTGGGGVNISYELDLFGGNRAARAAAQAGVASSLYDREALALVVSSEVAKTYARALALNGRIHIARNNRKNMVKTLDILKARFKEGLGTVLEIELQKTGIANADAGIATLENSRAVTMHALAVLVGESPQGFSISADSLGDLTLPVIAPGQPSALLERRPDIRKAEADLVAANANIGVARAAFFPSVNLGLAPSIAVSPLSSPATSALQIASAISVPLFNGGSLKAGLEKSQARERELAENYRHTVLTAFQEVEAALTGARSALRRQGSYTRALLSSDKAYKMVGTMFREGAIDYMTMLESERSLLSAKDNLVSANLDRLAAAIDLYKAVGGGWQGGLENEKH